MPYDDPALGPAEIRKIWKGKPDLVKALLEAREAGGEDRVGITDSPNGVHLIPRDLGPAEQNEE